MEIRETCSFLFGVKVTLVCPIPNVECSVVSDVSIDEQTKWEFTCCDIDAAVLGEFLQSGNFAALLHHAYNTCSP